MTPWQLKAGREISKVSKRALVMRARGANIAAPVSFTCLADILSCPREGLFSSELTAMEISYTFTGFKRNVPLF